MSTACSTSGNAAAGRTDGSPSFALAALTGTLTQSMRKVGRQATAYVEAIQRGMEIARQRRQ